MKKIKVGVIFGGISSEHEVSKVSGTSVISNLNKEKYDILPIYIDEKGNWNTYEKNINEIKVLEINTDIKNDIKPIANIEGLLKTLDVVFPVLHGIGGEDGSIQGMFELFNIPYVGCGILASSVGMDKVYTKIIFEKAGIKQAKYEYIRKFNEKFIYVDKNFNEEILELDDIIKKVENNLKFPMFIKPSNSGSSVGINKANNIEQLRDAIKYASKFDKKIIIEEGIVGKEVECAVFGNEEVTSSCIGEIKPAEDFYTFDAKYKNQESKVLIPANISEEISEQIRKLAIKAFKVIDGKGLSRVDFFVNEEKNEIFINEINTLPGFTEISMYPKLWEQTGLEYSKILDEIIKLALEK